MTLEEFQSFINAQDQFLRSVKTASDSDKERILARTVKLAEEFGELCNEVLASIGDQRQSKTSGHTIEDLGDEFADVVITTFLLAKSLDVDVMKSLERKIAKIKAKHNKELSQ